MLFCTPLHTPTHTTNNTKQITNKNTHTLLNSILSNESNILLFETQIIKKQFVWEKSTLQAGFEPTTSRLTAVCSAN